MSDNLDDKTREQITKFLPTALRLALESYKTFLDQKEEIKESKKFKEHHDACKVALAHVALLLKLGESAEEDGEDLTLSLENAQAEIAEKDRK